MNVLPIAGKTGTAQGAGSYPWNDSSAFAAFSLDDTKPYTVVAYLEKSGFGAKAAAPVVKCIFTALPARRGWIRCCPAIRSTSTRCCRHRRPSWPTARACRRPSTHRD